MVKRIVLLAALWSSLAGAAPPAPADVADQATLQRGRYLVAIGGCNDCHTPGYPESGGQVAEAERLTGSAVGFQGPWGTSYPSNLRLRVAALDEAQWISRARSPMLPPMPWLSLRDMSDEDLSALYRYIRSLGARGEPAPAAAAPGQAVTTPYFDFVSKNPPQQLSQR